MGGGRRQWAVVGSGGRWWAVVVNGRQRWAVVGSGGWQWAAVVSGRHSTCNSLLLPIAPSIRIISYFNITETEGPRG